MPDPEHIPDVARRLLSERMATHGQDMSDLVWAMLFVDERSVEDIARNIAAQPRLARPTTNDATELSSQLPPAFFDLQDDLGKSARRLADEARERNIDNMADAYGALTATCVRCHAAYLTEPPQLLGGEEDEMNQEWLRRPIAWVMSTDVLTVSGDTTIGDAIATVLDADVSGVPVIDEDGVLLGMVTKSALLSASRSKHPWSTPVVEIMMPVASVLTRDATIANAAAVMVMDGTHRVAVVRSDGTLEGLVSSLDLIAEVARADGYLVPGVRKARRAVGEPW